MDDMDRPGGTGRADSTDRTGRTLRPDVVVVGAGAAGCALAARLSEDPGRTVLLLEAGADPYASAACRGGGFPAELLDARLVPGARPGHPAVLAWPVHLTPDRPWSVPRGRVLGGSTTVNGGAFVHARPADFARWTAAGNPAWAPSRVLPRLRAVEDAVPVHRTPLDHPAAHAFQAAARALGFPEEPDKNDPDALPGVGPVPSNALAGLRRNAALCYLTPEVRARRNLHIRGGIPVARVVVERGRAVGVLPAGASEPIRAGEVVLCAGALGTARLLQLSGIGPRADLQRLSLPVIRDAPAVGTRFGDHPQLVLDWYPARDLPEPEFGWAGACLHAASGTGPHSADGDLEVLQSLVPMEGLMTGRTAVPGAPLALLVTDLAPRTTGRLRLASADPAVPPRVDHGYLTAPGDLARLRTGVRTAAALLAAGPMAALAGGSAGVGLRAPEPAVLGDDAELDGWIATHLGTAQHTCGTVPMGAPDGDPRVSAADQYGRVHGVPGLRVADASLLPDPPLRGPAATAVLVGEVVADAVRRGLG